MKMLTLFRAVTIALVVGAVLLFGNTFARAQAGLPGPTPDASQIDDSAQQLALLSSYILTGGVPPQTGPALGEAFTAVSSGLFTYSKTDLTLAGPMPINVTRVYRSADLDSSNNFLERDFGLGTRLNYNIFLYSDAEVNGGSNPYANAQVIMPDGGRINCQCRSGANCSAYTTAILVCNTQPTGVWFNSSIRFNSATPGWDLARKDGTVYSFGQGAPLQKIKDRYGNQLTITHSSGQTGRITRVASSNGRYVNFAYADSGNPNDITSATDSAGRTVSYSYTIYHKLQQVTMTSLDPVNAWTKYEWNTSPNQGDIKTIKPNINTTAISPNINFLTYDAQGRFKSISSSIPSSGYVYVYTKDGTNTYIAQCDVTLPDNSVRTLLFNSAGYITSDQRASGDVLEEDTTYVRNPTNNLITSVTEPLDATHTRQTTYAYDPLGSGSVSGVTHTPGPGTLSSSVINYTYEASYDPVTSPSTFARLKTIDEQLTPPTTFAYQSLTSETVTDPVGRVTTLTFNSHGQLTISKDNLNNSSSFGYDPVTGDGTSSTDPLNNQTQYVTDGVGRVTQVTSPLGNQTNYAYDAIGDVRNIQDGNGFSIHNVYDLIGELIQSQDQNGNITTITIPYTLDKTTTCDAANNCTIENRDPGGRMTTFFDKRNIKTANTYDKLGRVTQMVVNPTNIVGYDTRTLTYSYDLADRVRAIGDVDNGGAEVDTNYTYDGVDNVMSEAVASDGVVTYNYDANNRRTLLHAGTQAQVNYTYWNDDQVLAISNSTLTATFAYDGDGRRNSVKTTGVAANAVQTLYAYDSDSRPCALYYGSSAIGLSSGTCSGVTGTVLGNLTYSYDADSRVIGQDGTFARTNFPPLVSAAYSNTNQITTWNGATANSDPASNLTHDPASLATYAWDARNQLSSVTAVSPGLAAIYDALGRRRQATSSGSTTTYLHDGGKPVRLSNSISGVSDLLTVGGENLTFSNPSGTWVPLLDAKGSTIAHVGTAGTVVNSYTYDPFGNSTVTGASVPDPFRFQGIELDATGLYHTDARYYSSRLHRFLSADPLGGSANQFAYAANDPVNSSDPSGLCVEDACVGETLLLIGWFAGSSASSTAFWSWIAGVFDGTPYVNPKAYAREARTPFPVVSDKKGGVKMVEDQETFTDQTACVGLARQLKGNPTLIGKQGAFGPIDMNGAAVDPAQWGGHAALRGIHSQVSGVVGIYTFSGVDDAIGPKRAREKLATQFPDQVRIELPGAPEDQGTNVPVVILLPAGAACPDGTTELP